MVFLLLSSHLNRGKQCISLCRGPSVTGRMVTSPFHTTPPRLIHPALLALLQPLSRFGAIILGRRVRKWYRQLPYEEKKKMVNKIKKNKRVFMGLAALVTAFGGFSYYQHIEECPLTQRKRFLALNTRQMDKIAAVEFQQLLEVNKTRIVPESHPVYVEIARVANRILRANSEMSQLQGKNWTITVVDDPTRNAFVLPSGNIFVFSGMLQACDNEDQLGIVLSHEIAHTLLAHVAEKLSYTSVLNLLILIPLAMIWAIMPNDGIALVADWFCKRIISLTFELPFSRLMESEADQVGLLLAAKACLDVREAPQFWGKMAAIQDEDEELPELLSTHPAHLSRQSALEKQLPEALNLRLKCGCQKLKN